MKWLAYPFIFCWQWLIKPAPQACLICGKPCLDKIYTWECSYSCFAKLTYPPEHKLYVGPSKYLKGKTAIVMYWHPYTNHADPKKRYAQFDDKTTGYGFGWSIFNRGDFVEAFPRKCCHCFKYEVYEAIIDYEVDYWHDHVRLGSFIVEDLRIPICDHCGEKVFTNQVDEQIHEARKKFLDNR